MNLSRQANNILYFLLHLMALSILFILPLFLINFDIEKNAFYVKGLLLQNIVYVVLFYLNYSLYVPKLLFKKRVVFYVIVILATIAGASFLIEVGYHTIFEQMKSDASIKAFMQLLEKNKDIAQGPPLRFNIYTHLLTGFVVTGFSIGLRVSGRLIKNEKEKKDMEQEKLHSELAFLKNQVSPHFFFNTLNNIYSLIAINTEIAQKSVLSLSKLMRYLLYESEKGDTMMSDELDFMTSYIDLMKLRLSDKVDLQVQFPKMADNFLIAPLLFIPFIENAFKHGVSYREKSFIHISIEVIGKELIFSCRNSYALVKDEKTDRDSGIGIDNVKKRLALLFPDTHSLLIEKMAQVYSVLLKINLQQ